MEQTQKKKYKPRMSARQKRRTALYMFLGLLLAVVVLAPVVWMFLSSVMLPVDLTAKPLSLIPKTVTFERYAQIFKSTTTSDPAYVFRIALKNSLIIAVSVTILSLVIGTLSAYAFAHVRFRGKGPLMLLILFTYMLPPAALIIPLYRIYNSLGWLDKRWPLVILYLSFIIPEEGPVRFVPFAHFSSCSTCLAVTLFPFCRWSVNDLQEHIIHILCRKVFPDQVIAETVHSIHEQSLFEIVHFDHYSVICHLASFP